MDLQHADRPSSCITPMFLTVAIALLGAALQLYDGGLHPAPAIVLLSSACFIGLAAISPSNLWPRLFHWQSLAIVCCGALMLDLLELWRKDPVDFAPIPWHFHRALLIVAAAAVATWLTRGKHRMIFSIIFAATFTAIAIWLLRVPEKPFIDVNEVTHDACQALAAGHNPYAITFRDIYADNPDFEKRFYAPGVIENGRVMFGYQYMPLTLQIAELGYLAGDFRFAHVAAVAASAILLTAAGGGWLAAAAASLLVLTPRQFFVLEAGWAEPVVVLCLCAVVYCAQRKRTCLPYALGLLIVSKQHMLLAVPLTWLLIDDQFSPRERLAFASKAIITAGAVTLPLILWDVRAFSHSAVDSLAHNPFREDSLNLAAWWVHWGHHPPQMWWSIACATLATVFCLWRLPRSAFGFSLSMAIVYLAFFALAKQAFTNYYYLVAGALCCALASWKEEVCA